MMNKDFKASSNVTVAFGPYRFNMLQRRLTRVGQPVHIPSRASTILAVLIENAGELVSKRELMSRVWNRSVVEDSALRVQVSDLRKRLRDGKFGLNYIESVTGQGYRFIAPARAVDESADQLVDSPESTPTLISHSLHPMPQLIGRGDVLPMLMSRISETRFLSLVGPGGVGKTAVAAALAHQAAALGFQHVRIADLSSIADADEIESCVASSLGRPRLFALTESDDIGNDVPTLLVINDCDQFPEIIARLIERILERHANIHILATTRECLRSKRESIFRLAPLSVPPLNTALSAAEAQRFAAVELFVNKAYDNANDFNLKDSDVAAIVHICRKTDGLPLAIELAAQSVGILGVHGLASSMHDCLSILTRGARTAPPRQQTLRASLDWSYTALNRDERATLEQVAVFTGTFSLQSAQAVLADDDMRANALEIITKLADKSMVMSSVTNDATLFQLLETTKAYALNKLADSDAATAVKRRHAEWCLAKTAAEQECDINDIRCALQWCFSDNGDATIGMKLTASSAASWINACAAEEYKFYIERALQPLRESTLNDCTLELEFGAALARAIDRTQVSRPNAAAALDQTLAISHQLTSVARARQTVERSWLGRVMAGDYCDSLNVAEQYVASATRSGDLLSILRAGHMQMVAQHLNGNHNRARTLGEQLFHDNILGDTSFRDRASPLNQRVVCYAEFSRILWMQGFPDQALAAAEASLHHADSVTHVRALCRAFASIGTVLVWSGKLVQAQRLTGKLLELSRTHELDHWHLWGLCLESALQAEMYGPSARHRFEISHHPRCTPLYLDQMATLSASLATTEAVARAESGIAGCAAPEILRAHGERLLRAEVNVPAAEAAFKRSLALASEQNALSWELRSATSLASLWEEQGQYNDARDLLVRTYDRFTEGKGTADVQSAAALIDLLRTRK